MTDKAVPATIEQNVKERMKLLIGELIPDEQWDKLIQDNVREFKTVDLPKLVKAELTEHYKRLISEEFQKPEWREQWGTNGQRLASDAVREILKASAGDILAAMMGFAAQQVVQDIQYKVQGYR